MQIEATEFLEVAEKAGAVVMLDIEATNLRADFGTTVVVSLKPYGKPAYSFTARPGRDKALLKRVTKELEKYSVWVSFYGKLYDLPFLQSRCMVNGLPPIEKKPHLDLWQLVRSRTALSRRNQAHLLEWLQVPERKLSLSSNVWAELPAKVKVNLDILQQRCESDVEGLEALYDQLKPWVVNITR